MSYWKNINADAKNLRFYQQNKKWLAWDGDETLRGARAQVEYRLMSALNATNLMVLLGSGASFAAKNDEGDQAPSMNDLWDGVRQKVGEERFDKIVARVRATERAKDIEALLSYCKMSVELQTARGTDDGQERGAGESSQVGLLDNTLDLPGFVRDAEQAILDRVNFVSERTHITSHKEFLRRLARRSAEKSRVKLFTTNYDRCIEEAAAARNLVLIDGFSHSVVQRFNRDHFRQDIVRRPDSGVRAEYLDGVFHLYKLHGSVDWRRRKSDDIVIRVIPRREQEKDHEPVLIYPRSSKYQEAFLPPYLDMFAAWQTALREPDTTLIVSGFGFADDHISAPIWSALESNLSIRVVLCDPCFIPEHKLLEAKPNGGSHEIDQSNDKLQYYQERLLRLVREGDDRVTVLNGRFSDLALALPESMGETDRQRLEARLERIRGQDHGDG